MVIVLVVVVERVVVGVLQLVFRVDGSLVVPCALARAGTVHAGAVDTHIGGPMCMVDFTHPWRW